MKPFKLICIGLITIISSSCQVISPLFVDYYDVRMDVAEWINHQQLLSMKQKHFLVQLSKAQQKLYKVETKQEGQRVQIIKENMITMHCAEQYISKHKIEQLQNKIFNPDEKKQILDFYNEQRQKVNIDLNSVKCGGLGSQPMLEL